MRRPYRDNADDYRERGIRFLQAWTLLGDVECPPSAEVFEHGYVEENRRQQHVSPPEYAEYVAHRYQRTDADREQRQPWYRWSHAEGRLVSA